MMRFEPRAVQAITCVSTWRLSVPKRSAHENEPSVLHALADGRVAHRVLATPLPGLGRGYRASAPAREAREMARAPVTRGWPVHSLLCVRPSHRNQKPFPTRPLLERAPPRHSTSTRKPPVPESSPTTHPTVGRPTPAKTAEHAGESAPATGPRRGRSRLLTWQTGCDGVCALRAASSHLEGPSWPSSTRQSPAIALTRRRAPLPRRQAALVQETGP